MRTRLDVLAREMAITSRHEDAFADMLGLSKDPGARGKWKDRWARRAFTAWERHGLSMLVAGWTIADHDVARDLTASGMYVEMFAFVARHAMGQVARRRGGWCEGTDGPPPVWGIDVLDAFSENMRSAAGAYRSSLACAAEDRRAAELARTTARVQRRGSVVVDAEYQIPTLSGRGFNNRRLTLYAEDISPQMLRDEIQAWLAPIPNGRHITERYQDFGRVQMSDLAELVGAERTDILGGPKRAYQRERFSLFWRGLQHLYLWHPYVTGRSRVSQVIADGPGALPLRTLRAYFALEGTSFDKEHRGWLRVLREWHRRETDARASGRIKDDVKHPGFWLPPVEMDDGETIRTPRKISAWDLHVYLLSAAFFPEDAVLPYNIPWSAFVENVGTPSPPVVTHTPQGRRTKTIAPAGTEWAGLFQRVGSRTETKLAEFVGTTVAVVRVANIPDNLVGLARRLEEKRTQADIDRLRKLYRVSPTAAFVYWMRPKAFRVEAPWTTYSPKHLRERAVKVNRSPATIQELGEWMFREDVWASLRRRRVASAKTRVFRRLGKVYDLSEAPRTFQADHDLGLDGLEEGAQTQVRKAVDRMVDRKLVRRKGKDVHMHTTIARMFRVRPEVIYAWRSEGVPPELRPRVNAMCLAFAGMGPRDYRLFYDIARQRPGTAMIWLLSRVYFPGQKLTWLRRPAKQRRKRSPVPRPAPEVW